ncbi:MAG: hypothetical protein KDA87_23220, partial [Planctomycetales bacterium]|nr:hypothetical protein [Planctomycetales bacterium]
TIWISPCFRNSVKTIPRLSVFTANRLCNVLPVHFLNPSCSPIHPGLIGGRYHASTFADRHA